MAKSQIYLLSLFLLLTLGFNQVARADETARLRNLLELGNQQSKKGLKPLERSELFRAMYYNPVARLDKIKKYDPSGLIGFCFGRSTTGAIEGSQLGLDFSKMSHMFIVGDLKRPGTNQTEWRFHVTFVAPDSNGALWAFDPIAPYLRPIPLYFWIRFVQKTWDPEKKARLYKTSVFSIMPDTREMIVNGRDWPLLIDIDFDPTQFSGFNLNSSLVPGEEIFELSPDAEKEHFLTLYKDDPNPFDLKELSIQEGPVISFNGYFNDLLEIYPNSVIADPSSMIMTQNQLKSSSTVILRGAARNFSIPPAPKPDDLYKIPGVDAPLVRDLSQEAKVGGLSGELLLPLSSARSCDQSF